MAIKLSIVSRYDARGTKQATAALTQFEKKYSTTNHHISDNALAIANAAIELKRHGANLQRYGAAMSSFGGSLTKYVTAPALAAGAALAGITLRKGWDRLVTIDTAKKKLEGLGHSAESISSIMDSAAASVRGTAFGMGEAATVAASTVAAGVKEGDELTRVLTLVGDSATIAGTDFATMGNIWNKVAAKNKVSAKEVNQLTQKGIPILQALAEHYGVTAAEASEMVSRGKVDFKAFSDAMEAYLGGAAQKSGETFSGAIKNIGAAVGRIGANVLDGEGGGMFSQLKPALEDIRKGLSDFEPVAAKWGNVIGAAFAEAYDRAKELVRIFIPASNSLTPAADAAVRAREVVGQVFDVLTKGAKILKGAFDLIPVGMRGWVLAAGPLLKMAGGLTSTFGRLTVSLGKGVGHIANWVAQNEKAAAAAGESATAHAKQTAKTKLLGKEVGKLGGLAKGAAVGLAAIGVALAVTALVKLYDHIKTTNTALHGFKDGAETMRTSAALIAGDMDVASASFDNYHRSVRDAIEKQAEFAQSANETYSEAGAEIGKLEYYGQIIAKYGDAGDLTAQQQAELAAAVEYVNEATGTNIEITDRANGALSETPAAVQKAIEAKKKQIEADAALAVYQEAVEQHIRNEIALKQASAKVSEYDAKAKEEAAKGNAQAAESYAKQAEIARGEVDQLKQADAALNDEMRDALDIYGDITGETKSYNDETRKAKESASAFASSASSGFGKLKSAASTAMQAVKGSMTSNTYSWGKDFGDNWKKGLEAAKIEDTARSVMDKVSKVMKFSVPKAGVWSGSERGGFTSGRHMGENWAQGLLSASIDVQRAANAALSFNAPYTAFDGPIGAFNSNSNAVSAPVQSGGVVNNNYNVYIDGTRASVDGIEDAVGRFLGELSFLGAVV